MIFCGIFVTNSFGSYAGFYYSNVLIGCIIGLASRLSVRPLQTVAYSDSGDSCSNFRLLSTVSGQTDTVAESATNTLCNNKALL